MLYLTHSLSPRFDPQRRESDIITIMIVKIGVWRWLATPLATKLIIIETGFPAREGKSQLAATEPPSDYGVAAIERGNGQASHKPLNFLNPSHRPSSHVGVGSETRFRRGTAHAGKTGQTHLA